ncbi:MAG: threonine--tRNA ligase [Candidatus Nanoarchaeia archaeon]|nr:threonine--tRNA ligase [Candidatus Nanoarchaeia archaeon]MDD4563712.1 threonine--tRNA ligase [Candidatus Nanoarchaeia archaeon]
MKTLNLHCDYIKFKALKKALKQIEEISPNQELVGESKECLVVLTAIEKNDNTKESIELLIKDIENILSQLQTKNIVLYPYAHLSKNLGNPQIAIEILEKTYSILKEKYNVIKAPFGYYKQFELKVKGHPLSELSREININEEKQEEISEKLREQFLKDISKSKLDTSKLKENDHRIIGKKMDLWSFNPVAPGMVFWHNKGLKIKNNLIKLWRELHREADYQEISTPQVMDRKLWEISGHWSKYGENNFKTNYEGRDFIVKPMNCPGGMLVYKTSPKSYKDLPLRVGEIGTVHRVELSGVLAGLFRVIQFNQDDAHIFCTEEQLEKEVKAIIELINKTFSYFKLEFDHVELSTRPEKRIGNDKIWDLSEKALENILIKTKMKYTINKGDGAFYGPKIDFHLKDSLNRTWQCSTIQLDMALPERFDLTYTDESGNEKRPIMLHRVIYGSIERFIGIITEHLNGKYPLWLSPNQIKVLTLNDNTKEYANQIYKKLFDEGFEVEIDERNETMNKKVRDAQIQRYNYILTIGEKELKESKIAIKKRDEKEIQIISIEEFIKIIKEEIKQRKN